MHRVLPATPHRLRFNLKVLQTRLHPAQRIPVVTYL
jgi:hypothetical protein